MLKKAEEFLKPGEKVIFHTKKHKLDMYLNVFWLVFWLALSLVSIIFGISTDSFPKHQETFLRWVFAGGGFVIVVITIWWFVLATITYLTYELVITNTRVFDKCGWISNHTEATQLSKIESIELDQGIIDRIFDTQTVVVNGTGGDDDCFYTLDNSAELYITLQDLTDCKGEKQPSKIPVATQTPSNVADKLEMAAQLLMEVASELKK